jgi:pyruvate dehydrogenase E2 component (dihydrolipoamide acetyltransferase)
MSIEIKLPDLGEGIESGDVLSVLVNEGDTISADQGIVELETDKAVAEVPCPQAGRVTKIHVKNGQTVAVGATLITLEAAKAAATSSPAAKKPPEKAKPDPPPAPETKTTPVKPAPVEPAPLVERKSEPPLPPRQVPSASLAVEPPAPPVGDESHLAAAAPSIRRLAREVGIDLTTISGTGPGERITRDDVLAAVRAAARQAITPAAAEPRDAPASTPSIPSPSYPTPAGESTTDAGGPVVTERVSKIRATIARNMVHSKSTAAHVTNFDDADVTELEEIRKSSKVDYASKGIKLTTMAFVLKAVGISLRQHPTINASLDSENNQIIYKQYVNLGIAVDTERGLMVPVIQGVDNMSIPEVAKALSALAEKARASKITIDEMRGGTFTISNLGAIGGTYSTPVINVPEAAILLIGRSREMPVVVEGDIKVRLMMPLSISYDHRLVDGAAAARFLNDVKGYLQTPGRLLLAP